MSDFVRGLLVMYALAGLGSALVYIHMSRYLVRVTTEDFLKILSLVALGPMTGWIMLWGSIRERVRVRDSYDRITEQVREAVAEFEREEAARRRDQAAVEAALRHTMSSPHAARWN